ncbi:MAG: TetR/AcrR family transcriptional regulator [Thermodesulfobacteriota bacterium]
MSQMKEKIKEVAVEYFHKKSYFATGVNDLALASGIRKASIYHHYPSKEEILFDILKTTMADLEVNLERSQKGLSGAEEKLRAAIRSHVLFHLLRQKEVIISDSELRALSVENYKIIVKMRDRYEREFQTLLGQGQAEGIFAPGDVKVLSYAVLTMCTAVATWFKSSGRLAMEEIARIYENFIMNGLKHGAIG